MNEAELEQRYTASLDPLRSALVAPYGEWGLAITQAATRPALGSDPDYPR